MNEADPLSSSDFENRRRYVKRIAAISRRVETYLDRTLELTSYTEYFDTSQRQLSFFVKAHPVSSITSVKSDSTGEYDGSESSESNYYIGAEEQTIVLATPVVPARRGLQVVYTGGMANHGVNSVFEVTITGSFSADKYVQGRTSAAVGCIVSESSGTLTVEVLYGIFQSGEIIDQKTTESGAADGNYATIDSVTSRGMAEAYPDIVEATELQIRYMDDHRSDYENTTTAKGQTARRGEAADAELVQEVKAMLDPYKRIMIG